MKRIYFFIFFYYSCACFAQGVRSPLLYRYTGIGTYSSKFTDVFSFANNQAALSKITSFNAGIYAERRFMLEELDQYAAAMAVPFKKGGLGVSVFHTGKKHYRESQVGLAYGRALGPSVTLGMQFNYHLISIAGYGNTQAIHAEIGSILHITDDLYAGFHVHNLLNSKLRKDATRKQPVVYTLGLGYELSELLFLGAEIAKVEDQPVNMNIALHYTPVKQLLIRGGLTTGSNQVFVGTGVRWKDVRMDIVGSYHPQLGITPSLLLIFGKQKETE